MIAIDPRDADELAQLYVVANTPSFLWERLRSSPIVHAMANNASVSDLMETYRRAATARNASSLELATAYAALVAVTLKDFSEARAAVETLSAYALPWAGWIINAFLSRPVSWNSISVNVNPMALNRKSVTDSSTPSSVNQIDVQGIFDRNANKVVQ